MPRRGVPRAECDHDFETTGWSGELGTPRFGGDVRLVDIDGSVIDVAGMPGEIQLRSAEGWARRVIPLPGQAIRGDNDGWVAMGDIGEYDEDGRLWFRCRSSEVVNVGGEKVSLRNVEASLQEIPGVREAAAAAAAAVAHPILGSAVAALVVTMERADEQQVRDAISRHLRGADRPYRVLFDYEIPLTENGKVSRSEIARLVTAAPHPMTPVTEEALMELVRSTFGETLSINDSITDSDASSLALIMFCADLGWRFGVLLDAFDALSASTFADLAATIRARQAVVL
ncbi:AMP-binding enzyme [Streptomyces lydicus]